MLAALVVIAATLLISALAVWLAELLGSAALSCLVLGILTAMAAVVLYRARVRGLVQCFGERLDTVYKVSDTILRCYRLAERWFYAIVGRP